jgi:hypothetical protein
MSYALVYRVDLGSAQSPFRVVAQPTGREVGWINRFLRPRPGLAYSTRLCLRPDPLHPLVGRSPCH